MPPTPLETTLTATSSVDSFDSASRSASALPCTSALMTTCTVAALPSPICDSMSSSFVGPCFASLVSRNLPWRYSATSRALRSLSTTSSSSPAFGAPDRPSTTTGSDGPASVTGWPFSSNIARTRPNSWPAMIGSPGFSVPRLTSTVATAPRPFSMLDSMTTPAARPSRAAFSSSTSACSRIVSSSSSMPCAGARRHVHEHRVAAPVFGQHVVLRQVVPAPSPDRHRPCRSW